jgi:2-amino-4-hydroxy-6-hydroxymethyldihydropteridine diphosphokinase
MADWAFVALGSNMGDRAAHLALAREHLALVPRTTFVAASTIEETAPLGSMPQGPYLNQMVLLRTELAPRELLGYCAAIEALAGRRRGEHWGARTLDLDIVRYDDAVVTEPDLVVPHPGIAYRPFWQRELAELMPHAVAS